MFEDLIYALQNFKHNKIRTMLSLLGVIIGVASVIIIATLGESAKENVSGSFGSAGLDMVTISSGFGARRNSVSIQFNETFRDELWNRIPDLKTIKYHRNQGRRDTRTGYAHHYHTPDSSGTAPSGCSGSAIQAFRRNPAATTGSKGAVPCSDRRSFSALRQPCTRARASPSGPRSSPFRCRLQGHHSTDSSAP